MAKIANICINKTGKWPLKLQFPHKTLEKCWLSATIKYWED